MVDCISVHTGYAPHVSPHDCTRRIPLTAPSLAYRLPLTHRSIHVKHSRPQSWLGRRRGRTSDPPGISVRLHTRERARARAHIVPHTQDTRTHSHVYVHTYVTRARDNLCYARVHAARRVAGNETAGCW